MEVDGLNFRKDGEEQEGVIFGQEGDHDPDMCDEHEDVRVLAEFVDEGENPLPSKLYFGGSTASKLSLSKR